MGLEITSFHLSCGKEEKMRLSILQEDDFHKWRPVRFPEEIKWKAGRQAHQCAFIIAVCVEDVMAQLMSEYFPVSIFYECKKKKKESTARLTVYTISSLRIMNLLQNHTSKEVKWKAKIHQS